jgi:hypothetical protein
MQPSVLMEVQQTVKGLLQDRRDHRLIESFLKSVAADVEQTPCQSRKIVSHCSPFSRRVPAEQREEREIEHTMSHVPDSDEEFTPFDPFSSDSQNVRMFAQRHQLSFSPQTVNVSH